MSPVLQTQWLFPACRHSVPDVVHACIVAYILGNFHRAKMRAAHGTEVRHFVVLDEPDLQCWMERLLNIIGGYLDKGGYGAIFDKVTDDA